MKYYEKFKCFLITCTPRRCGKLLYKLHVVLNSFTAPIEQDCFGARIVFGNSSVIKLAIHHVSRKSRKFVQSPLLASTLGSAVVINSVVGVMAVSDVCSIA